MGALAKEHEEDGALGPADPNEIPDLGPARMFWRKLKRTVDVEEEIPPGGRAPPI